jgi:succinate-semialdehyde dehydrogenase / glutarate-semialdehyde dehydrogenase
MAIATINPATEEVLTRFDPLSDAEIEAKLALAAEACRSFRYTSFAERARILLRVAAVLEAESEQLSRLVTTEMGKPIRSARSEIEKSRKLCCYYASEGEHLLADEEIFSDAHRSYIRCEPLGAVLAVMPWNFPVWQVIRVAAPAIMAGNVVLVKHAPNVPQCAFALERIFRLAGASTGVFQILLVESSKVASLIADSRVAAVWLTGSDMAGSAVGAQAGGQIKKSVLELGGSDPFIVMPSAELSEAVRTAVRARLLNSGQSCVAAKRFIIADEVYEEFERSFVDQMRRLRIGDPFDEMTEVGPLATREALTKLEAQVNALIAAGAHLLMGGHRLDRRGFYYAPTVLAEISYSTPAAREELFGPVALLFRARNLSDAIRLANDTPFGLGASIWTNDEAECVRFVEDIQAGTVVVNGMVASDARFPFGGVKRSGYGRELGAHGLREFANLKTVRIQNWWPSNNVTRHHSEKVETV